MQRITLKMEQEKADYKLWVKMWLSYFFFFGVCLFFVLFCINSNLFVHLNYLIIF